MGSSRVRAWWATALVPALAVGGWLIGRVPPWWYPPCLFHEFTGLHCPGCGSARALHAVVHGDFGAVLGYNALVAAVLPLLAAWAAVAWWRGVRHDAPPWVPPYGWALVALVVVVGFGVLRNLPWSPFDRLAPSARIEAARQPFE
ncbi:DUF2752 domain-containing protein [Congregicoccus parvus]|uniref:DUF2752 domain-containing protein n=1 Tax=Congregicoccus parvus TaxID=3081749 RepID=UPI003FA5F5E3